MVGSLSSLAARKHFVCATQSFLVLLCGPKKRNNTKVRKETQLPTSVSAYLDKCLDSLSRESLTTQQQVCRVSVSLLGDPSIVGPPPLSSQSLHLRVSQNQHNAAQKTLIPLPPKTIFNNYSYKLDERNFQARGGLV